MIYEFVYDGPVLTANRLRSMNNRLHVAAVIREIKEHATVLFWAQHKGVKPVGSRFTVEIWDECKTASLRDIDAVAPTIKAVYDALQGTLYDDDKQIETVTLHRPYKSMDKTNRVIFRFEVHNG